MPKLKLNKASELEESAIDLANADEVSLDMSTEPSNSSSGTFKNISAWDVADYTKEVLQAASEGFTELSDKVGEYPTHVGFVGYAVTLFKKGG